MSKKRIVILPMLLLICILLSSCIPSQDDIPRGVWMSENPNIILYIHPAYNFPMVPGHYLGILNYQGEEIKISAQFFHSTAIDRVGGVRETILYGRVPRLIGDEMHIANLRNWSELEIDADRLVFHRLYDYDKINPIDWFPTRKHIEGVWENEEHGIVLYFDVAYQSPVSAHFLGIRTTNGESEKIIARLNSHGAANPYSFGLAFFNPEDLDVETGRIPECHLTYLARGNVEMIDGIMYFRVTSSRIGIVLNRAIVFYRTENYSPINPADWFR